jgi:hypothetical protein
MSDTETPTGPWWQRHVELIVVILLGIVSVATAYTSFQSSLYDGQRADSISLSEAAGTEAESLYLEGNQQYVQDSQTIQQLALLQVAIDGGDPLAQAQYDELYFVAVSEELDAAIQNAAAQDEAEPEFWHDPQADEDYQAALFGGYAEEKAKSEELRATGNGYNASADTLGLYTGIMAITLFLLGVAAVVRRLLTKWILIAVGGAIFLITAILTATIPFVWL